MRNFGRVEVSSWGFITGDGKMLVNDISPNHVITFWMQSGKDKWFGTDLEFSKLVSHEFLALWQKALAGRLAHWCESDEGLLALTIVLDQFPRIIFRDDVRSFCSERDARRVANIALKKGVDERVDPLLKGFLYLPFWRSENIEDQKKSIQLFTQLGDADFLKNAKIYYDVITRFGRFPHRNIILGRRSNNEEQAFLNANQYIG